MFSVSGVSVMVLLFPSLLLAERNHAMQTKHASRLYACTLSVAVREYGQGCYMSVGNLASMFVYNNVHVLVYVSMRRHVYVYEYDCCMSVHMCTYCICMYVMTLYSLVRIPLVSNCAK